MPATSFGVLVYNNCNKARTKTTATAFIVRRLWLQRCCVLLLFFEFLLVIYYYYYYYYCSVLSDGVCPSELKGLLTYLLTTNVLIIVTLHKVAGALYISDLKKTMAVVRSQLYGS